MAKTKSMIPVKARPINLVSDSPWSARENPPQDLGYPVNPGNVDEGQGRDYKETLQNARSKLERPVAEKEKLGQATRKWLRRKLHPKRFQE